MVVKLLYSERSLSACTDDGDTTTSTLSELRYPFESFWSPDGQIVPEVIYTWKYLCLVVLFSTICSGCDKLNIIMAVRGVKSNLLLLNGDDVTFELSFMHILWGCYF